MLFCLRERAAEQGPSSSCALRDAFRGGETAPPCAQPPYTPSLPRRVIDNAYEALGYPSLFSRAKLPVWFIMPVAACVEALGGLLGKKWKLNTFAVKMMVIHRWFDIADAERDLKYKPVVEFEQGWAQTVEWFRNEWKPKFGM